MRRSRMDYKIRSGGPWTGLRSSRTGQKDPIEARAPEYDSEPRLSPFILYGIWYYRVPLVCFDLLWSILIF